MRGRGRLRRVRLMTNFPHLGVGLSFRSSICGDLFANRDRVDFVEIVADHYFGTPREKLDELDLRAAIPRWIGDLAAYEGEFLRAWGPRALFRDPRLPLASPAHRGENIGARAGRRRQTRANPRSVGTRSRRPIAALAADVAVNAPPDCRGATQICPSRCCAPERSALPGDSSTFSAFTTPSSTSME